MAIKDGQTAAADEVMNAYGVLFANAIQPYFNQDYDGWNANMYGNQGIPKPSNFKYVAKKSGSNWTTEYDSGNTTMFTNGLDSSGDIIYSATTVDECNDSSIDANLWTQTGTGTYSHGESTAIYVRGGPLGGNGANAGTGRLTLNGTNATDYLALTADSEILFTTSASLKQENGTQHFGDYILLIHQLSEMGYNFIHFQQPPMDKYLTHQVEYIIGDW